MLREEMVSNFPYTAIRELVMNGCMHRDLQSNMPLRIYEFAHYLEITNAGGLYGNARPENFPTINDYRNPLIASAMKTMGYVNMFNRGVGQVQTDLKENGNPPAEFVVNLITAFRVNVKDVSGYVYLSNDGKPQTISHLGQALSLVLSPAVPSLSPDSPQLKDSHIAKMAVVIRGLHSQDCSITELMGFAGESNKNRFRKNVLRPLVVIGIIEPTIKDIPNSPNQRYTLTKKGKELMNAHEV